MKPISRAVVIAFGLSLAPLLFFSGCSTGVIGVIGAEEQGQYTLMIIKRTGLFKEGPGQQTPAEAYLEEGTRVRVVQRSGEFTQVETVQGQIGYVFTADIGPPIEEKAPEKG